MKIKARRDMKNEPVRLDNGDITVISLARGETLEVESAPPGSGGVEIIKNSALNRLDINIGGSAFTSYVYDPQFAKPYLGPILLSNGHSITRLDFETKEHPHQRSLIAAVGDVNGTDLWNEPADRGVQRHVGFNRIINKNSYAAFTASNIWEDAAGKALIAEDRTFTFYDQPHDCRYIDLEIRFSAEYGDVTFGATKEAGPLGIRVAESMRADRGGHIVNAYGAEGEEECWGRSAGWCAYGGVVEGLKCGVAIFDNEDNERYPTAWHVRNYGLFAANNLFFKGGLVIKSGETLSYKYRICIYEAESIESVRIGERFMNYIK